MKKKISMTKKNALLKKAEEKKSVLCCAKCFEMILLIKCSYEWNSSILPHVPLWLFIMVGSSLSSVGFWVKRNGNIRSRPYEVAAAVAHDKDKPHCTWMLFFKWTFFSYSILMSMWKDIQRHIEKKILLDACELEWTRAIKRDEKKKWNGQVAEKSCLNFFFSYPEARLSFFFSIENFPGFSFDAFFFLKSGTQYKYLMGFF